MCINLCCIWKHTLTIYSVCLTCRVIAVIHNHNLYNHDCKVSTVEHVDTFWIYRPLMISEVNFYRHVIKCPDYKRCPYLVHCTPSHLFPTLRDYLDADMNRTKVVIGHLQSLLVLEDPYLEQFITRSECAYYFSLSWLITWYGHVVCSQEESWRLMDLLLASHPFMSVYLAAAVSAIYTSRVLTRH